MEEDRRRDIGKRVAAARRRIGYRRQEKFAQGIGVSEASVANLERGAKSVGDPTFNAVETRLGWTPGAIRRFIEAGDESLLPADMRSPGSESQRPLTELERLIVSIHEDLLLGKMSMREATRKTMEVTRILDQDESAVTAAIERSSTSQA